MAFSSRDRNARRWNLPSSGARRSVLSTASSDKLKKRLFSGSRRSPQVVDYNGSIVVPIFQWYMDNLVSEFKKSFFPFVLVNIHWLWFSVQIKCFLRYDSQRCFNSFNRISSRSNSKLKVNASMINIWSFPRGEGIFIGGQALLEYFLIVAQALHGLVRQSCL